MKIVGYFNFKKIENELEGSVNDLVGEFFNQTLNDCVSERASLVFNPSDDIYEGLYNTEWIEEEEIVRYSLNIKRKESSEIIYVLEWINENGDLIFYGEAVQVDGRLNGYYHSRN